MSGEFRFETFGQMITEEQMYANLFGAKASKMMGKHFKTHYRLKFWVVYQNHSMSISCCLNMQTTNSTFSERHPLISLSHYLSIYRHLCTLPLPPSFPLSCLHCSLSPPTADLTYHLHGNRPAIFFLIAIRCMCDLSISLRTVLGATSSTGKQREEGGRGGFQVQAAPSLSLTFAASLILRSCSRICFVLVFASDTRLQTHTNTVQTLPYSTVSCWHIIHIFNNTFPVPDSTAFG